MALSRSTRITLLLVIDVLFFFVELIVGYAVGSLALVADSFHMLNDVMSLIVALYAIKMTNKSEIDSRYSYGWHRAEILAALVNGVFLLALCFSISLEAIQRFFETPEISNPKLVVVVGAFGLASNLVGLFLFHEHGHTHAHSPPPSKPASITSSREGSINEEESGVPKKHTDHHHPHPHPASAQQPIRGRRSRSNSSSDDDGLYGHPAATRASLVQTAHEIAARSPSPTAHRQSLSLHHRASIDAGTTVVRHPRLSLEDSEVRSAGETTPLLTEDPTKPYVDDHHGHDHGHTHVEHGHGHGHGPGGHGHAHGSMNMRALVLHVLGDALGNVGVIATGLIIWKSDWEWKYYCDPIISLIITIIIFSSALPLVKSASFILLQGVPPTVSLDEVKDAILAVDGVLSLHELHVWQLSENKLVASVHVLAKRSHDFMPIAAKIRKALHHLGIHSSTIQPEYRTDQSLGSLQQKNDSCLILCPADQNCDPAENACCPPPPVEV